MTVREFGLRSQRKKAASLGGARYEAAFKSARAGDGGDALASYGRYIVIRSDLSKAGYTQGTWPAPDGHQNDHQLPVTARGLMGLRTPGRTQKVLIEAKRFIIQCFLANLPSIENDNLTLPPAVNLVFDTNTEPLARLGDDQPKVQPQHTIVWTAMCGQMLAWVEDRKRCGNQPRDVLADAPCFWTQADVVIGAKAIAGQYEALPPAIVADHRCVEARGRPAIPLFARARAGVRHGFRHSDSIERVHGKMVLS